jgi:hypothetical protein
MAVHGRKNAGGYGKTVEISHGAVNRAGLQISNEYVTLTHLRYEGETPAFIPVNSEAKNRALAIAHSSFFPTAHQAGSGNG